MDHSDEKFKFNPPITHTGEPEPKHLWDYLRIILRRKWLILSIVTVVVSIAAIKAYSAIPLYDASCKILIEKEQKKIISVDEVYQVRWEGEYLNTQFKILTSKSFAKTIYEKLKKHNLQEGYTSLVHFINSYRVESIRDTRMASIIVSHTNPEKAAAIANIIATAFIDQNLQRKLDAVRYAVQWLSKELKGMQKKINNAEQALEEYVRTHNIVRLPKTDLSEDQSLSYGYFSQEQVRLEEELSKLQNRYKEKHPKILRIKSELATVQEKLDQEIATITDLRQKQIQYLVLKREVTLNQQLFNSLLNRTKETDLLQGLHTSDISIVDEAEPSLYSSWPNKKKNLMLALFYSLLVGIGLAFGLEHLDISFRNDEDVERSLGLPVLGHIPLSSVIRKRMSTKEVALACFTHPHSNFAEAYRYIRTGIAFSAVDKPHPVLLVTSTHPKEGKTTEAVNLGITIAATGEKVLLIDADMRRPSLEKIFPSKNSKMGLSTYLAGNISEESVISSTHVPNLWVLNCGEVPPNPSEILGSNKMRKLIEWATAHFKKIIIDSPPAMAVADPIVLSGIVDGIIYIIKANKTSRKAASQCIQRLLEARARVLGVVLNQVTPKGSGYYYYYNYKYNHYYQYGQQTKEVKNTQKIDEVGASHSS